MNFVRRQDKEHLILDAGHVGLMTSPEAKEAFWPRMKNWLETHSQ
jgi:hypothetical protein